MFHQLQSLSSLVHACINPFFVCLFVSMQTRREWAQDKLILYLEVSGFWVLECVQWDIGLEGSVIFHFVYFPTCLKPFLDRRETY